LDSDGIGFYTRWILMEFDIISANDMMFLKYFRDGILEMGKLFILQNQKNTLMK
jgi:hypothetical protein